MFGVNDVEGRCDGQAVKILEENKEENDPSCRHRKLNFGVKKLRLKKSKEVKILEDDA